MNRTDKERMIDESLGIYTGEVRDVARPARYAVQTSPNKFQGGGFRIWDRDENVEVCVCGERRFVILILDLLEKEEAKEYVRSIP